MQTIKVAQIIGNSKTGGVPSCVMNFYRNLNKEKVQFDFFTYDQSKYDEEIKNMGGKVFFMPKVFNFFKCVNFLKKQFKDNKYDIVHVHMTSLSFVGLFAAKLAGIKTRICHAHSTCHKSEKVWIVKNTLKHFNKIFATHLAGCSRLSCNWLYGKRRGEKAYLLHNAIDFEKFQYDEKIASEMKIENDLQNKKIIGNIGRFEHQKNLPFLIDVFSKIADLDKNIDLVLVGDGSKKDEIIQQIKELNLSERVHIKSEIFNVEKYYNMFDVFALPSFFEGLPLVAVEAQACGLQCLLSDQISKEINMTNLCNFANLDVDVWVENLMKLLALKKDTKERNKLESLGYQITTESKNLESFYEGVLNEKK